MINPYRSPVVGITFFDDKPESALDLLASRGGVGAVGESRISFLFHFTKSLEKKGELIAQAAYRGSISLNAEKKAQQFFDLNRGFGYDDSGSMDTASDSDEEGVEGSDGTGVALLPSGIRCNTTYGAPIYGI